MKKLLCLVLMFAMVFGLCACGKDAAGKNPSDTGASAKANAGDEEELIFMNKDGAIVRPEFAGETAQLESTVPFEGVFLKAEITSLVGAPGGLEFKVQVENLSDKQVRLELGHVYMNGLSLRRSYLSQLQHTYKMEPKQTLELPFRFAANVFTESGISKIYTGEVRFKATQYEGPSNLGSCEGLISFKTNEAGEQRNYTEGQTVYEKDGLRVVLQNTGWLGEDQFGYIRVFAENNSEKTYRVSIDSVTIAPYGLYKDRQDRSIIVIPGCSGYYTEWVKVSDIKASLPVQTASLDIKIYTGNDHLYVNNGWSPIETFTVDLSDWDWRAIKG